MSNNTNIERDEECIENLMEELNTISHCMEKLLDELETDEIEDTDTNEESIGGDDEDDEVHFMDELSEEDALELCESMDSIIEEYVEDNALLFSSPKFCEKAADYTTELVFTQFSDTGLIDIDQYSELYDYIAAKVEHYVEYVLNVPRTIKCDTGAGEPEKRADAYLAETQFKIQKLKDAPQPEQRTSEWYKFRHETITASNADKIFGTEAQRNSLILEKCRPLDEGALTLKFGGNAGTEPETAMAWGIRYEPVSKMIYEKMFNTRVDDFGCIKHFEHDFIAASPDGINVDPRSPLYGRMLEIKNPLSREITGIPTEKYWVQVQLQEEVCDLDECDFFETQFKEYEHENELYNDTEKKYRGIMLQFVNKVQQHSGSNSVIYDIMPLEIELKKHLVYDWINERKRAYSQECVLYNTVYWFLHKYSCVMIPRNKLWFSAALPKIREVWGIIERERVEGFDHRMSAKHKRIAAENTAGRSDPTTPPLSSASKKAAKVCLVKLNHADIENEFIRPAHESQAEYDSSLEDYECNRCESGERFD
jgi:putative phage-type endonuclease